MITYPQNAPINTTGPENIEQVNTLQVRLKICQCFLILHLITGVAHGSAEIDKEKYDSGWQLNIDNNIFQRYMKDRDYTGGLALTISGSRAQSGWPNIDRLRAWIFRYFPLGVINGQSAARHSVQYGMLWFTPEDISTTEPVLDDRPFASLLYITNTELTLPSSTLAYRSSLSLGLLGLGVAGDIQRLLHEISGSEQANGWDNQISAGGEPTAMLSLSAQQLQTASDNYQLSSHLEANLGYSTDINAGINWRWGRLNTPWWSFNPSHYEYIASATTGARNSSGRSPEFYVFTGLDLKYRFYSALLQGQFRDSVHSLGRDQVESTIVSGTAGVVREFGDNLRICFNIRGTSNEITGPGARNLWWAGLSVNRAW